MKVVIDIPEGWLQPLRNINLISWDSEILSICYRDYKDSKKFKDLGFITLPDNATNGDMIKAMFPNAKITVNEKLGEKGTVFVDFNDPDTVIIFDLEWWNSPFKRGE